MRTALAAGMCGAGMRRVGGAGLSPVQHCPGLQTDAWSAAPCCCCRSLHMRPCILRATRLPPPAWRCRPLGCPLQRGARHSVVISQLCQRHPTAWRLALWLRQRWRPSGRPASPGQRSQQRRGNVCSPRPASGRASGCPPAGPRGGAPPRACGRARRPGWGPVAAATCRGAHTSAMRHHRLARRLAAQRAAVAVQASAEVEITVEEDAVRGLP